MTDVTKKLPLGREYPDTHMRVGDAIYEFHTNGHAIIARRVATTATDRPEGARMRAIFADYATCEPTTMRAAVDTDVAALSAFTGAPEYERTEKCPACDRPGTDCEACDGVGAVESTAPDLRPCYMLDQPLNANLLAAALDVAGVTGPCRVWRHTDDASLVLAALDDSWRVIIAGTMPFDPVAEATATRFHSSPVQETRT
jgi:hypothetical protein